MVKAKEQPKMIEQLFYDSEDYPAEPTRGYYVNYDWLIGCMNNVLRNNEPHTEFYKGMLAAMSELSSSIGIAAVQCLREQLAKQKPVCDNFEELYEESQTKLKKTTETLAKANEANQKLQYDLRKLETLYHDRIDELDKKNKEIDDLKGRQISR